MKHYFIKILVFSCLIVFQPVSPLISSSEAAPNNNYWQQQQASQRAAQAQRNARMAAERARRQAQRAAEQAKLNATRTAKQAKINAQRIKQNQHLLKNKNIQNTKIREKTLRDQQNKRAMERAIQQTIQTQRQQVANDNHLKIKVKLSKLKELKKRKDQEKQLKNSTTHNKTAKYSPINRGPLADSVAKTFRSSTYTQKSLSKDTVLYRVISKSGNPTGSYWTKIKPKGPLQSVIDSALKQKWKNTAARVVTAKVPAGTKIYEGAAAAQGNLVGGGNQIFIPKVNPKWIQ